MGKKLYNKKFNSSKTYVVFAIIQFIIVMLYAMGSTILGYDTSGLAYIIPSSAGVVGIALGFYYNKAKMENLSKQRIRYVYLKLMLENKLTPEQYEEINAEIENIDMIINNKINYSLEEAVNQNVDNNI